MTQRQVLPADESGMVHEEHVEMRTNLGELDQALNRLSCDSGIRGDLSGAPEVWSLVRHFQAFLPLHFRREEKGLHKRVSAVSPELKELTLQLRQEHQNLADLFKAFSKAASNLKGTGEITVEVTRTKLLGGRFTNQLLRHMATEESELAGFL